MPKIKSKEYTIKKEFIYWYKKNRRNLPWRRIFKNKLPNPYYVLVSEFMLQQTTVGTVKKKFNEFIKKWPNLDKLSLTNENNILKFWSGLGYYTRARNLLKTSKIIKKKYNNIIPKKYDDLINLPGIGDYTAKAILGIAFNKPFMPIDANIERIISRVYCLKNPINKEKINIKKIAEKFITKNYSNIIIQSFMDYGSSICLPRNPKCNVCMISNYCITYKKNLTNLIPLKKEKNKNKICKFTRAYVIFNHSNEILIRKRSSTGMLASMLEIPSDKWVLDKKNLKKDIITSKIKNKIKFVGSTKYSFSHFDLKIDIFFVKVIKNDLPYQKWIKINNVNKSGLPTIMKKILQNTFLSNKLNKN